MVSHQCLQISNHILFKIDIIMTDHEYNNKPRMYSYIYTVKFYLYNSQWYSASGVHIYNIFIINV